MSNKAASQFNRQNLPGQNGFMKLHFFFQEYHQNISPRIWYFHLVLYKKTSIIAMIVCLLSEEASFTIPPFLKDLKKIIYLQIFWRFSFSNCWNIFLILMENFWMVVNEKSNYFLLRFVLFWFVFYSCFLNGSDSTTLGINWEKFSLDCDNCLTLCLMGAIQLKINLLHLGGLNY